MAQYSVYSRDKLKNYIIPIFDKYPLLTAKYYNYLVFKKAFSILEDNSLSYKEKTELIEKLKNNINYENPNPIWSRFRFINEINIKEIINKE
jgi:hypothetical protein